MYATRPASPSIPNRGVPRRTKDEASDVSPIDLLLLLLALPALVGGIYWTIGGLQLLRAMRRVPTLPDALKYPQAAMSESVTRVCVIVPAHNERASLGRLAESLAGQDHPALRVVFALDRCTDDSRAVLADVIGDDERFEIIEVTECPDDWAGKVNAIRTGVEASRGALDADVLVFADADTHFAPECVRAALAMLKQRQIDALSLLSTLEASAWYERLVQPAASLELLRQYPIERANEPGPRRRPFANGQFMMFTKEAYERIGGHAPVRRELLEDIALARLAHREGLGFGLFLAGGLLRCAMYADYASFRRGWKRIYTEAANRKAQRLRKHALGARTFGVGLPGLSLASLVCGAVFLGQSAIASPIALGAGLFCVVGALTTLASVYRVGGSRPILAPLYPVGAWIVGSILREAASDLTSGRPTEWGGMQYHREQRT